MTTPERIIDFHMHSNVSDGTLSPTELVNLAYENNVDVMALTDHDTTRGLAEARMVATEKNMIFINGVELSVTWQKKVLHIVGLNIDPENVVLQESLLNIEQQRLERAERIAKKLDGAGIPDALEGAKKYVRGGLITRPHFAQFLVEKGLAKTPQDAFNKYLGANKKAYVSTEWPTLEKTLGLIKQAGGVSVLAHPLRYKLTASWMRRLLSNFKEAGGDGMEVICGNYTPAEIQTSQAYAIKHDLMGSVGSDFHGHSHYSAKPGIFTKMSDAITPVWSLIL